MSKHQTWPDIAKGVGIILVVFGHAWRAANTSGMLPTGPVYTAVDQAIYAFHMPLFLFLSGWFFPGSLQANAQGTLFRRVLTRILYPMCIWTYLFILLQMAAGGSANTAVDSTALLRLPVPPYQHLWFLWALAVLQGIVILLRPLALRHLTGFFAVITALAVVLLLGNVVPYSPYRLGVLPSAPYFFLGALWSRLGPIPGSRAAAIAAIAIFIAVEAQIILSGAPASVALALLVGLVLLVSVLIVVRALTPLGGPVLRLLQMLGVNSMAIYLMHTVFSAATRIGLLKVIGTSNLALHLLCAVLAGLFLPLLIYSRFVPDVVRLVLLGTGRVPQQAVARSPAAAG